MIMTEHQNMIGVAPKTKAIALHIQSLASPIEIDIDGRNAVMLIIEAARQVLIDVTDTEMSA